jgi:hypothetical protein
MNISSHLRYVVSEIFTVTQNHKGILYSFIPLNIHDMEDCFE